MKYINKTKQTDDLPMFRFILKEFQGNFFQIDLNDFICCVFKLLLGLLFPIGSFKLSVLVILV